MWLTISRYCSETEYHTIASHYPERMHYMMLSKQQYRQARVKSDELRLGNTMYDVVSVTASGDSLSVCLYKDSEEETALGEIGRWLGQAGKKDQKGMQWLSKIMSSPQQCICAPSEIKPFPELLHVQACFSNFSALKGFSCPDAPPPDSRL